MILLTGAAGFIGSCLLRAINESGRDDIIIVDHFGCDERYRNLIGKSFYRYFDKNILWEWIDEYQNDIDLVIHLGACTNTKEKDTDLILNDNYYFSQRLLDWATLNDARFIYSSSSATYGTGEEGFCDDYKKLNRLRPIGNYGFSKHMFDMWAWKQMDKPSQLVGLKFFNVFGPNEYHKGSMASVIYSMYTQIEKNGIVDIFYDENYDTIKGGQSRDFIYVLDLIKIIMFFVNNPKIESGIYNAGTSQSTDFNKLASILFEVTGKEKNITYTQIPQSMQSTYQLFTRADMTQLRNAGYNEEFLDIKCSIQDYIKKFLRNKVFY